MKVTLLGVQPMDFGEGKDNVKGNKIFFMYGDPNVIGSACSDRFRNSEEWEQLKMPNVDDLVKEVGCVVDVDFNQKGKLMGITILSAPAPEKK